MHAIHVSRKEGRKESEEEGRKTVPFFRHFDKLVMEQWFGREGAGMAKDYGDSKGVSVWRCLNNFVQLELP